MFFPYTTLFRSVMDWVNEKYLRRIEEVLKEVGGGQAPRVQMKVGSAPKASEQVVRSVAEPVPERLADETGETATEEEKSVAATVASPRQAPGSTSAGRTGGSERRPVQVEGDIKHQSFLNETFTFDTFVEGKSNQLAQIGRAHV